MCSDSAAGVGEYGVGMVGELPAEPKERLPTIDVRNVHGTMQGTRDTPHNWEVECADMMAIQGILSLPGL